MFFTVNCTVKCSNIQVGYLEIRYEMQTNFIFQSNDEK